MKTRLPLAHRMLMAAAFVFGSAALGQVTGVGKSGKWLQVALGSSPIQDPIASYAFKASSSFSSGKVTTPQGFEADLMDAALRLVKDSDFDAVSYLRTFDNLAELNQRFPIGNFQIGR